MTATVLVPLPAGLKLPTVKRVTPSNAGVDRFDVGRPGGRAPSKVIKHSTVSPSRFGSSAAWLSTHPTSGVSCHTLANRDGSLTEIVPPMWVAYHAGCALPGWGGADSLGLEIENSSNNADRVEPYPLAQVQSSAYRTACWQFSFGIPDHSVKHHREVAVYCQGHAQAGQLGRKQDCCGPWPEDLFNEYRRRWLDFLRALPPELHVLYII
jgi:N-acetyl-anhydromuramyl-L-alanine amidase AmpD